MLPGGLLAAAIVQVVVIVAAVFFTWLPEVFVRAAGSYAMPYAFVVWGAVVAPQVKLQTASVLAVLAILAHGVALGAELVLYEEASTKLELLLAAVLGTGGSVHGVFSAYMEERKQTWTSSSGSL